MSLSDQARAQPEPRFDKPLFLSHPFFFVTYTKRRFIKHNMKKRHEIICVYLLCSSAVAVGRNHHRIKADTLMYRATVTGEAQTVKLWGIGVCFIRTISD